jgi:GT2 family glycosyltransferase/glycosyltransferase involved in cell wall biosynthesis
MTISTIIKNIFNALAVPVVFARKITMRKILIFLKALKNESPQQIFMNFKKYFWGNENNFRFGSTIVIPSVSKNEFLHQKAQIFDTFMQSGSTLSFPDQKPILSIILVLFNKVELSFACIQSILENVAIGYEVIIVDNNSTDETKSFLERISGAKIIRNFENYHFIKANNQALEHVEGQYLLFLNNDTEIYESTISSAINTLINNEKCGAVGGKLISLDGSLQEAGSIIWSDASCLGYGRNDNPNDPRYNFKRVVDYCSAAFLLTYTHLFKEHEGFDTRFSPAYYEETDYCLWLQERGLQVIYDPGAIVTHFEFGSGVKDAAISLHQKNQQVFFEKHKKQLKKHFDPHSDNILNARFAASQNGRKKILYIDDRIPHVDFGSGFPRSNSIVKFICELGYDLTIYPLNFPFEDEWESAYRDINPFVEIAKGYGLEGFEKFLKSRKNYFEIFWVSRPHNLKSVAGIINLLKGSAKILYDSEAIVADREIMKSELNGKLINNKIKMKWYNDESSISDIADIVLAVSAADANIFTMFGRSKVFVLGHTLEVKKDVPDFDNRSGLLFIGNLDFDASPNVDSLIWFINDIFPIIKKQIPDITFNIVGSAKSPAIKKIKNKGVLFRGRIDSADEFYEKCRVFVAPTRFAAGIPFKIHEAASHGLPVVATQLLCDQLGWQNEEEILAARIDKLDFAQKVITLYQDKNLWQSLQEKSIKYVGNQMSSDSYKQKIAQILNSFN